MTVLPLSGIFSSIHEPALQPLIDRGQYKEAISSYSDLIAKAPREKKSWLKSRLAVIYAEDQDQEKAFQVFLEALETAPTKMAAPASDEEKTLYAEALKIYLDQSSVSIEGTASTILEKYGSLAADHPDYHTLKLLVSMAKANLSQFDDFFIDFYESYQYLPDHHLSYKTRAILHIKLYERARTKECKDLHRDRILALTEKSLERYRSDRSLYKVMIAFSADYDSRRHSIMTFLPMIIDQNVIIPRCDILFYVKQAIAIQHPELAQRLIDKAREWYQYSKAIEQAQHYIDSFTKDSVSK